MNNLNNIKTTAIISIFSLLTVNTVIASESGLSFSVRLNGGGWSGKNKTSGTEFQSTEGGQIGFNGAYQNGNFYTGLNVQGGEYTFEKNTPDQVSQSGRTEVSNDKVEHNELDLIFGYYLTRHFSLFVDIKGVSNTWASNNYQHEFSGVGFGATGSWPINKNWVAYGSVGAIPSGEIKTNDEKIGEGSSRAVDIGAMYQFSKAHRVMAGIKRSNYTYKFDSGDEQTHSIGGVYFGYSFAFSLN